MELQLELDYLTFMEGLSIIDSIVHKLLTIPSSSPSPSWIDREMKKEEFEPHFLVVLFSILFIQLLKRSVSLYPLSAIFLLLQAFFEFSWFPSQPHDWLISFFFIFFIRLKCWSYFPFLQTWFLLFRMMLQFDRDGACINVGLELPLFLSPTSFDLILPTCPSFEWSFTRRSKIALLVFPLSGLRIDFQISFINSTRPMTQFL